MPAFLIGLVVLAIAEIYVFVLVAHAITGLGAVALLVLSTVLGGRLVRHEGARTFLHLQQATLAGSRLPAREVVDGALVAVGGALLVVPGFITTVFGLLLVLPFTRPLFRVVALRGFGRRLGRSVVMRVGGSGAAQRYRSRSGRGTAGRGSGVIDGEVVETPPPSKRLR